jgi:hypothetical protein
MAPRPSSHKEPSGCRIMTKCSNLSVSPILQKRSPAPRSPNLLGLVYIKSVDVQCLRVPENLRRLVGEKLVSCQDKFWIETVRRRFVNRLPRKIPLQAILKVVVGAGCVCLAIRGKLSLFVQHDKLRTAPWLPRLPDVSPKEIIPSVKPSSHEIITGRLIRDGLIQENLRLGQLVFSCLTCGKQQRGGG